MAFALIAFALRCRPAESPGSRHRSFEETEAATIGARPSPLRGSREGDAGPCSLAPTDTFAGRAAPMGKPIHPSVGPRARRHEAAGDWTISGNAPSARSVRRVWNWREAVRGGRSESGRVWTNAQGSSVSEQLIRKEPPAAPQQGAPRRKPQQTNTTSLSLHPGMSACNGLRWNHVWNHTNTNSGLVGRLPEPLLVP